MKSDTNPHLSDVPVAPARQLPLFPLDPWGAEQTFALLERPCPGIARAMLGPMLLGEESVQTDASMWCLAVTQDGTFAASIRIRQAQRHDPNALWRQVIQQLAMARQRPLPSAHVDWRATPEDCLKAWSDPAFWVSIPPHAQAMVGEQIVAGVLHVLSALEPKLCEVVIQRPRLSLLMAHHLIGMAKPHSPSAVTYALQALRTESMGVLHLIASGQPENDAKQVQEAIFSGRSLPDTFANLGIAKAAHRRSVYKPARCNESVTEPGMSLSELPISGRDWLTAMRLTQHLPLQGKEDWFEFNRVVQKLLALNFQQVETVPRLLRWYIRPGCRKSCERLDLLLSQARAFAMAARGLVSMDMGFDDAILLALALVQTPPEGVMFGESFHGFLDPDNLVQLVMGVSQISGKSINQLMRCIFDAHPGLPRGFQVPEFVTIEALNSMDLARAHGTECDNCLQTSATIVRYVAEGAALYGVRSGSGIAGTIALRYDSSEDNPKVQVQEVKGVKNAAARFDLCRLAQSLADSWNTAQQVGAWVAYEDQCAQWRQLVSPSA